MQIEGAGALVSGGASGLGAATVRALAKAGAIVTIVDRNAQAAEALAAELGDRARWAAADVSDPEQVQAAVDVASDGVPLRVVANCAGIGWVGRVINRDNSPHDLSAFETVVRVNLIGTFNVMRLAASRMARNDPLAPDGERGVIVNTASVAAFEGQIGQIAYAASKGGVVGMTLPAARDLASVGIRVVTIAPGTFDTPLFALAPPEVKESLGAAVPFPRRMGNPAEFAALVVHIAENAYLNGEVIRLDGAIRMQPK